MSVSLSVVVPAYNAAPYLEDCLNSILSSTFQDYEILLIDDGSTDETGVICDRFAEKYPNIKCVHTENRGICVARNLGIEMAQGELISFIDSDDLISPHMLEMLVSAMAEDIQMTACRFVRCAEAEAPAGLTVSQTRCLTSKKETAEKIIQQGYGSNAWNKLFRKSILLAHSISFRVGRLIAEDQFFLMDYLPYCEKAVFLDARLYCYIMHGGSIMNTFRSQGRMTSRYIGLPQSWAYTAELVSPLSEELGLLSRARAAMFYQTVLRKLENPSPEFIQEAVSYVRQHKGTLLRFRWGYKYYLSALVLCLGYPLWAVIFRRGMH